MMSVQVRDDSQSQPVKEPQIELRQAYLRRAFGLVGPTSELIASMFWGDRG